MNHLLLRLTPIQPLPAYRIGLFAVIVILVTLMNCRLLAQVTHDAKAKPESGILVKFLNVEKTHYIKFKGYAQIWARYTEMNPGSKIEESILKNTGDLSLRRLRLKMSSKFSRLADPMITYDFGLSLLLKNHASKLVFNAQSRPVYTSQMNELRVSARKMMYVIMYQINIE